MKIVIPVNEKSLESEICFSFGRAPYFLFYNTETKENYYLDNNAAANQGGAGIKSAQLLIDEHANILLASKCGENAEKVLRQANILMYKTKFNIVKDNIDAFINNQLVLLNDFHVGFHNHGK